MAPKPIQDSGFYRALPQIARRPAPNEPGTLRQQFLTVSMFRDEQNQERRTGTQATRLWTVCHALACDRPISCEVQS